MANPADSDPWYHLRDHFADLLRLVPFDFIKRGSYTVPLEILNKVMDNVVCQFHAISQGFRKWLIFLFCFS